MLSCWENIVLIFDSLNVMIVEYSTSCLPTSSFRPAGCWSFHGITRRRSWHPSRSSRCGSWRRMKLSWMTIFSSCISSTALSRNIRSMLPACKRTRFFFVYYYLFIFSSLTPLFGVRTSIWSVKNWVMRCWHDHLERCTNDMHMAHLIALPPS